MLYTNKNPFNFEKKDYRDFVEILKVLGIPLPTHKFPELHQTNSIVPYYFFAKVASESIMNFELIRVMYNREGFIYKLSTQYQTICLSDEEQTIEIDDEIYENLFNSKANTLVDINILDAKLFKYGFKRNDEINENKATAVLMAHGLRDVLYTSGYFKKHDFYRINEIWDTYFAKNNNWMLE